MYQYKEKLKEKYENKCNIAITGYLLICYIISLILIIIWLFKLNKNAKSEPSLRNLYIIEDLQLIIEKMNSVMKIMNHS